MADCWLSGLAVGAVSVVAVGDDSVAAVVADDMVAMGVADVAASGVASVAWICSLDILRHVVVVLVSVISFFDGCLPLFDFRTM